MKTYPGRSLRGTSVSRDNPHIVYASVFHWCMRTQTWRHSWNIIKSRIKHFLWGAVRPVHFRGEKAFSRQEVVSSLSGRYSTRRLRLDANWVPADLTGERDEQLVDGLHITLLRWVIAVQPRRSTLFWHWVQITSLLKLDSGKIKNAICLG